MKKMIYIFENFDLQYLPMFFITKKAISKITSFPSKLVSYMNAKILILSHSPRNAVLINLLLKT